MEESSRVIVRGLPKYTEEKNLKEHFSKGQYDITDVKLIRTRDGISRRFGFIGFKTHEAAVDVCNKFHNTYLDTAKITVELALPVGATEIPRPWSKYSTGSSAYDKVTGTNSKDASKEVGGDDATKSDTIAEQLRRAKEDAALAKFLQTTDKRNRKKTWANDDPNMTIDAENNKHVDEVKPSKNAKVAGEDIFEDDGSSSDEEYQDLANEAPKDDVPNDGEASDVDNENEHDANPPGVTPGDDADSAIGGEKLILETGRLYVRNLSYLSTEEDVRGLMEQYGPVVDVHVMMDKQTLKSKGKAMVLFMFPEHALRAYKALANHIFQGRLLQVLAAKPLPTENNDPNAVTGAFVGGTSSYKVEKERKLKERAMDDFNWNALFMRPDAVADAICTKHKIKKADLLNKDSDNLAVRMAVAETQIIDETKKSLVENGVDLDIFATIGDKKRARSKNIILVKNLPSTTSTDELGALFSKYGQIGRIILTPSKLIALVEFVHPQFAKKAFVSLSYSRFRDVPLYLEWAPSKILGVMSEVADDAPVPAPLPAVVTETHVFTIYVKNLSYDTTEDKIKEHFSKIGPVRAVTIQKAKTGKRKGKSMGYGFVEFNTERLVHDAIAKLQGTMLDGHALQLSESSTGAITSIVKTEPEIAPQNNDISSLIVESIEPATAESGPRKLMIRNVPFQATQQELKQLFSTFAGLENIRMPKKMDGTPRGFAFAEFVSEQEALKAMNALKHTHLYGRHLVIEWAKQDETIDEARDRTKRTFQPRSDVKHGPVEITRTKRGVEDDDDEDDAGLVLETGGQGIPDGENDKKKKRPRND